MQSEERTWILISRAISGQIPPLEEEELEMLFIEHPELRTHFEAIRNMKLSADSSTIKERRALERGLAKFEQTLQEDNGFPDLSLFNSSRLDPLPRKSNKGWLVAASIIGLFIVSVLGWHYLQTSKPAIQQELATHYGKRINTILPDGSKIWLNSGSSIHYAANFGANGKREVELNGEAFFDVMHDAKHPFIVHAGKFNVVVLGTAFNVKAYSTDSTMETTLIRGKVVVLNTSKPGSKIVLLPNEKLTVKTNDIIANNAVVKTKDQNVKNDSAAFVYNKSAIVQNVIDGSIDETSWISNKLVFKKERFSELAAHLDRWYNVEIIFDNDKYTDKEFTGAFKDQDISVVMHALQLSGSFHYTMTNNQIHIY